MPPPSTHYERIIRSELLLELELANSGIWREDMPPRPAQGAALSPPRHAGKLYSPGYGGAPPLLAGRDGVIGNLQDHVIGAMRDGEPPGADMAIWAPRGVGKTVLLNFLQQVADSRRARGTRPILTLRLQPAQSVPAQIEAHFGRSLVSRSLKLGAQAAGVGGSAEVGVPTAKESVASQLGKPLRRGKSVLLLIDEAHRMDPEDGAILLDALQALRGGAAGRKASKSIIAVFAGTPDLPDHLRTMNATYWDRMRKAPINLISDKAVAQAVFGPLVRFGRTLPEGQGEAEAVTGRAVALCAGHPYFTQCLGRALHEQLLKKDQPKADMALMARAEPEFSSLKTDYYRNRWREIWSAGLVEVACHVIAAFRLADGAPLSGEEIEMLAQDGLSMRTENRVGADRSEWTKGPKDAATRLLHSGFIWGTNGLAGDLTPSIPCLHAHVHERASGIFGKDMVAEICAKAKGIDSPSARRQ